MDVGADDGKETNWTFSPFFLLPYQLGFSVSQIHKFWCICLIPGHREKRSVCLSGTIKVGIGPAWGPNVLTAVQQSCLFILSLKLMISSVLKMTQMSCCAAHTAGLGFVPCAQLLPHYVSPHLLDACSSIKEYEGHHCNHIFEWQHSFHEQPNRLIWNNVSQARAKDQINRFLLLNNYSPTPFFIMEQDIRYL